MSDISNLDMDILEGVHDLFNDGSEEPAVADVDGGAAAAGNAEENAVATPVVPPRAHVGNDGARRLTPPPVARERMPTPPPAKCE